MVDASSSPAPLLFTSLEGVPVRDRDGRRLGRLADLVVRHDDAFPRVTDLVVRPRRDEPVAFPLESLAAAEEGGAVADRARGRPLRPEDVEIGRDFLDAQVVDIGGKRVARVGDVELAGRNGELRAVAVDVGLAPVARRLGLGRLSRRLHSEPIAWDQLHFATGRGHDLQLASSAAAVHRLGPAELLELVARLPAARGAEVLEAVAPELAPKLRAETAKRRKRRFRVLSARKRAPS